MPVYDLLVFANIKLLWDFGNLELSEQRFRAALHTASPNDALILHTQIARVYGLKRDFEAARAHLQSLEPHLAATNPEAQACYHLELGRTYTSAAHPPEQRDTAKARAAYNMALEIAKTAQLDGLAIDTLHMLAMLETEPLEELKLNQTALELALASAQPDAKNWEASLRNNLGMNLHTLGRLEEALLQFKKAVLLRQASNNSNSRRIAEWMVAWTLRSLCRYQEALEIQLRLEQEFESDNAPDPYVFEELEQLYLALGATEKARIYATKN